LAGRVNRRVNAKLNDPLHIIVRLMYIYIYTVPNSYYFNWPCTCTVHELESLFVLTVYNPESSILQFSIRSWCVQSLLNRNNLREQIVAIDESKQRFYLISIKHVFPFYSLYNLLRVLYSRFESDLTYVSYNIKSFKNTFDNFSYSLKGEFYAI